MNSRLLAGIFLIASVATALPAPVDEARRLYAQTHYSAAIGKLQGSQEPAALQLLGQSYLMLGDTKRACEVLDRAVAAAPLDADLHLWLGRAYGHRAETAFPLAAPGFAVKARENFERSVELNPRNFDALDDLFEFYLQAPAFLGGGTDKANKLVALIAKIDPAEAVFGQARIAEARKQYDSAEVYLRQAAELAPNQGGRNLDLARFLARRGRFDESDAILNKALASSPNTPKIVFTRADVLVRANRNLPEARDLLKRYLAFNLSPNDPPRHEAERLLRKASGT